MGSQPQTRRSTLADPPSPERMRPPAGALLYCHPLEPRRAAPSPVEGDPVEPGIGEPRRRSA